MEMSRKSKRESRPRTSSLKGYTSKVLAETSLSGIISARSTCQKVFKTSVFLFSLMGFFYQTGTFLEYILGYPTILSIQVSTPVYQEIPAFTFCNVNGISRTKFCRKYPDRCEVDDVEICYNSDSYCEVRRTLVPRKEYYSFGNRIEVEEFLNLTYRLKEMLVGLDGLPESLHDKNPIQGPVMRSKTYHGIGRVGCFSVHSLVKSEYTPAVIKNHDFITRFPMFVFAFDVQRKDVFLLNQPPGMMFEVHSPYLVVNPIHKGIFMEPGRSYKIYVTTKVELLQPYPYDTDCINYTDIWLSRNKTGPRIQEMCINECYLEVVPDCIPPSFQGLESKKICEDDVKAIKTIVNSIKEINACLLTCKRDCRKLTYTRVVQEHFIEDLNMGANVTDWNLNNIIVEVYFDNSVVSFEHRPQYQDIEVFSYIGGFIGMWLGISLIQVIEFLEAIAEIVFFYFTSKRKTRVNTLNGVTYKRRNF